MSNIEQINPENPTQTEVKSGLKDLIVERLDLDVDPASIQDEAPLFEGGEDGEEAAGEGEGNLALDSVEALEIVIGIEEKWGVVIEDDSVATEFYSIETLSGLVVRLLTEGNQEAATGA